MAEDLGPHCVGRGCRVVVIGGGPAGLTCALYLARFNAGVEVVFRNDQRARLIPRTWNFPGHPEGVPGDDLIARCRAHAEQYGARMIHGEAAAVTGKRGDFRVRLAGGRELGCGFVVFATGVDDIPPDIPRVWKYLGRGLRHCPVCDGYEANDQRLALFGTGDKVARHALYLTTFTGRITILLNGQGRREEIAPALLSRLDQHSIPVLESRVVEVRDEGSEIRGFLLADGTDLDVDRAYSALDVRPRSEVAAALGVALDAEGYIVVSDKGLTNVDGVYAIGDVASADYAQIVIGMGQAAIAAICIQELYLSEG